MEFSFTEEQVQIKDLAKQILRDNSTDEFLLAFDKNDDTYSRDLWNLFAESGLLGMAVPEEFGGSGFGIIEVCQMLEEQGRYVAPIPLAPSLMLAGLPLAKYASQAQNEKYLAALATGESILTAAVAEQSMVEVARSECTATQSGDGWTLTGVRECVPFAGEAAVVLVPATTEQGTAVFLVEPSADGVSLDQQQSSNWEPLYTVTLDGATAELMGDVSQGDEIVKYMENLGNVAASATMVGVTEDAIRRTAEYTNDRKQFGTSIASFQNTTMRCADAYIDIECIRSCYYQAMWKLAEGLDAEADIHAAKWWACTGGSRVTHTAQHLHGGIGSDIEYPLHRYFLWCKQLELALGGGSKQLADLGAMLADRENVINML